MIKSALVAFLIVLTFLAIAIWVIIHYGIEDSKRHKRPFLLVSGTISSLIGFVLFCMAIDGLGYGEIDFRGLVVRSDNPFAFWRREAFLLVEGALFVAGGIWNFTRALNLAKKSLDEIITDLDAELERNDRNSGIWTCPNCGTESDETHGSCWRCGTEKPKAPQSIL